MQGLNYLAGFILKHYESTEEEAAFWFLVSLLQDHELGEIYWDGMVKLQCVFGQLESAMHSHLKALYLHFLDLEISPDMYATQWIITFFTSDLPSDIVYPIIDLFLMHGYEIIVQVILTILKLAEDSILN